MHKIIVILLALICRIVLCEILAPDSYSLDNVIPNQYIVRLKDSVNAKAFVSTKSLPRVDGLVSPIQDHVIYTYDTAMKGFTATLDDTQLSALDLMPEVVYIEADTIVELDSTIIQHNATWGLARTAVKSWPKGSNVSQFLWDYAYNEPSGDCAIVYVIDTGINIDHEEFEGRAVWGESLISGETPDDGQGHGTHVAGTIGGKTYGIAKNVILVSVKVFNVNGTSSAGSVVGGIDWATRNATSQTAKRPVFNLSLRAGNVSAVNDGLNSAIDMGVTVVVSAGNANNDSCLQSPAMIPRAITVAASNINDTHASFSSYGPCVDVYAPGVSITSAWVGSNTAIRAISGTSMSSPHTAGMAADYICRYNLTNPADVDAKIKQNAVRDAIQYVTPLPLVTNNLLINYGYGINQLINCGVTRTPISSRVVGGVAASRGQFPWQAYIETRRSNLWSFSCGATILNDYWVLTAAHCVQGLSMDSVRVVVGADYLNSVTDVESRLMVSNITIHESYDPMLLTNDIALLRVSSNINTNTTDGYINGVCLPDEGQKFTQYLTLSGWGYSLYNSGVASNALMYANNIPIVSLPKCRSIYGNNAIRDGMLCAGGEEGGLGSCQGDSGGPLIQSDGNGRYLLVGISSFSLGCAEPGIPGVYVEISYYRDWIDQYAI